MLLGVRRPPVPTLRDLHRDLSPPQESVSIFTIARMRDEADAHARLEGLVTDPQWLAERFVGCSRETKGRLVVRHRREDRELVAGDARDDRRVADGLSQSRSDRAQQRISESRAQRAIQILEMIDVEIEDGDT